MDAAARVFVALDRPGNLAEIYLGLAPSDPSAMAKVKAALERTGNGPTRPALSPLERWPGQDKKGLRPVTAVVPGPEGSAYLLSDEGMAKLAPGGQAGPLVPLAGARDLSLDFAGSPVALGAGAVLWGERVIRLPSAIVKPVSAAAGPDGSLFVLERGDPRLHRLSAKGVSMGSVAVSLDEPARVRVDRAGRIYLASRDGGQIRVYGADMAPVRTMNLTAAGKPVRKIEDLCVDFAGNLFVVDGGGQQALLFSSSGQLLASVGGGATRVDAAGWDGLNTLLILDHREGVLWRYGS